MATSLKIEGLSVRTAASEWGFSSGIAAAPTALRPNGVSYMVYTNDAPAGYASESVNFHWTGGTGSDVLQICENSSFRGPTLRSLISATNCTVSLPRGTGKVYYWRVFSSARSPSSEVASFQIGWLMPNLQAFQLDYSTAVSGYDLIQFSEPNISRLIQANTLETTVIMKDDGTPVLDAGYSGTPVTIQFSFKEVNGVSFSGWADGTNIYNNLSYKLYRAGDWAKVETGLPYGIMLHTSGTHPLWSWDASSKTYKQTLFLQSIDNSSVGEQFVLETTVDFNASTGAKTVVFYKTITVEPREKNTSVYDISLLSDQHDSDVYNYLKIKGSLLIDGDTPLFEGSSYLHIHDTSETYSRWFQTTLSKTLLDGMYIRNPVTADGFQFGYIVVRLSSRSNTIPYFSFGFEWFDTELTPINYSIASASIGDICFFQKICDSDWIYDVGFKHKLVGLRFCVGSWAKFEPAVPLKKGEVYVASALQPPVTKGLLGVGAETLVKKFKLLTPENFEIDPNLDGPSAENQVLVSGAADGNGNHPVTWGDAPSAVPDGGAEGDILMWNAESGAWIALDPYWALDFGDVTSSASAASNGLAVFNNSYTDIKPLIGSTDKDELYWDSATSAWVVGGRRIPDGDNDGDVIEWDSATNTWVTLAPKIANGSTNNDILVWNATTSKWDKLSLGSTAGILQWTGSGFEVITGEAYKILYHNGTKWVPSDDAGSAAPDLLALSGTANSKKIFNFGT